MGIKLEENIVLYDSLIKLSSYEPSKLNEVLNQIEVKAQKPKTKNQIEIRNVDKARYRNNTKTNFYFYDVKLVELGKKSFQTIWGQRTRESYWRSVSTKVMPEAAKKEEPASSSEELEKIELDNQGLLLTIPRTNFQKDSINRLKNKSYLRLAEIYLEKYKDYPLTESKLNQLMSLSPAKDVLAEANYLLYKSQKKQNKKEAKKIRLEIIKKFPSSKFAKILKDRNNLIVEEKETLSELDSLQLLYNNQKFEQVLSELEKKMVFIENKEILFEFDLLKAQTIGRLEGVLKYNEQIKNMIDRYPNSPGTIDLKILSRAISIKWQTKPKKTTIGNYNIVFKLSNSQSLKDALSKTIKKIKKITLNKYRVSVDVYDSSIKLIVVTGLKSKENANELSDNIKEELEFLKLNNNFVVLSSEYKNMLIYKTLDLD